MKFHLDAFVSAVKKLAPVILLAVPGGEKIAPHVDRITDAIIEAEQIKGASGAEKKAHVLSIVQAGVDEANANGAHLDPGAVGAVASHGIDAVIGSVKLVHPQPPAPASASQLGAPAGSIGD